MEPMNIPLPPEFTEEQLKSCSDSGEYSPVLFEWYKYVGRLANYFACISLDSPGIRDIDEAHHSILIGLLNRCSRLILSNVTLSHEGLFGETTSIIDRCIFESAIKLNWLCANPTDENFNRFIAEGLKTEVEFKKKIELNIRNRGGEVMLVEERMLRSIESYFQKSRLTEEFIAQAKNLPNLAQMIEQVGHDRLAYVVGQKIGSHHVHGTWASLWFHYLAETDGVIVPRDHNCPTHINQYVYVPLVLLDAIKKYFEFLITNQNECAQMIGIIDAISEEITTIFHETSTLDREAVSGI